MQFKKPDAKFKAVDILLLFLVALPFLAAIALKVLFMPAGDGMEITGAFIFFTIKLPVMDLPISEAQVNSWAVVVSVLFLCLYLTHGIRARVTTGICTFCMCDPYVVGSVESFKPFGTFCSYVGS